MRACACASVVAFELFEQVLITASPVIIGAATKRQLTCSRGLLEVFEGWTRSLDYLLYSFNNGHNNNNNDLVYGNCCFSS